MKILFWGTPEFALPPLRALGEEGHEVVGVVTQPDRPAGRGRRLRPSAVKQLARAEGYPVLEPERPRGPAFMEELRALRPDLSVVVAYGHILPMDVVELPPEGSVNVHASLLPRLRGAAPVHRAILEGDGVTGVTIMRMAAGMDTGPILLQRSIDILEDETVSELSSRLSELGAAALVEALTLLQSGEATEREQDHEQATFAPKVDRETARVRWEWAAPRVADQIRGLDASPGAWSPLAGSPVKLFRPRVVSGADSLAAERPGERAPGEVVAADSSSGLVVATGDGLLEIQEVQPSGKPRMTSGAWMAGRGVTVGQRFGP